MAVGALRCPIGPGWVRLYTVHGKRLAGNPFSPSGFLLPSAWPERAIPMNAVEIPDDSRAKLAEAGDCSTRKLKNLLDRLAPIRALDPPAARAVFFRSPTRK